MAKPDNEKSLGQDKTADTSVSAVTAVKPELPPIKPFLNWTPQELEEKTGAGITYSQEGPDKGLVSELNWPRVDARVNYVREFGSGKVESIHAYLTAPGLEASGGYACLDEYAATVEAGDIRLENSRAFAFATTVVRILNRGTGIQVLRFPR